MKQKLVQFFSGLSESKWPMSLLLPIILVFSLYHVTHSVIPTVQYHPAYRQFPAEYVVEAAPSKKWHDANNTVLVILSFIVAFGVPFVYIRRVNKRADKGSFWPIGGAWLLALFLFFIQYIPKNVGSNYTSVISVEEFEANKADLNAIFPRQDK